MKKADLLMLGGLVLSGLAMLANNAKDKAELKEAVKEEVDRQLHGNKKKEEEP